MTTEEILKILEEYIQVAFIATVDADGKPHNRPINIGLANEKGVFFMTSPKTHFYQQLMANPEIALTGLMKEDYLIQVIRIEGVVRPLGKERLNEVLEGNEFVSLVYPDEQERSDVQVFQLYQGKGFYHSLTQGHRYTFTIQDEK